MYYFELFLLQTESHKPAQNTELKKRH